MIDGLRPYPEMRPSGLAWLGDVPAHWDVRRIGRLFGARRDTGFPELPILEVSIRSGVRIRDFDEGGRKQEMADRSKYQRAMRGDIAYNMMRMWQGAVGIAPTDGLVSPAYVVARPFPETDAAYYAYLFRTTTYMREIDVFSRGIVPDRNRLYWESFKQMPSVYPPLDEQRLIVRFLDWHGAQTAKLIRAKKKLIALLNEQKQAIIHRAVTRGLDPNVELKPSGIPWLGDVPEGWEVKRLRSISRNITSGSRGWSRYSSDHGPLFVRIANLSRTGLHLRFDDVVRLALPVSELGEAARTRATAGDLLLSITAFIGSVAIVPDDIGDAYVSQHVACCRLVSEVNPRWIGYVLLSPVGQAHGTLSMYGGTKQGLSLEDVKNYVVLLPPREIQNDVTDWIDKATRQISNSISVVEREIALIQEFRARLIADVVTGKLDVRAMAASLPETIELEPIDEPTDDEDLDETVDDPENEEVAA
ncbi:MAG TPA: restriction endonuclease subunit S [Aliidongia sp.]|nr:restriction endonuclease subunit S [Aliidongia sp.]